MEDKVLGLLGLMRRAKAIEIGTDNAVDAVHAGRAKLLLLSGDIADNARRKAENATNGRRVITVPLDYSRSELAGALGVSDCSMAAVTDIGFANALMKELAAKLPDRYGLIAETVGARCEKNVRRKKEKAARLDSKRNGKRRTEV